MSSILERMNRLDTINKETDMICAAIDDQNSTISEITQHKNKTLIILSESTFCKKNNNQQSSSGTTSLIDDMKGCIQLLENADQIDSKDLKYTKQNLENEEESLMDINNMVNRFETEHFKLTHINNCLQELKASKLENDSDCD